MRISTKSESKILRYVIDGKCNREIAQELHRSIRTIEVHRSRIMQKFGVDNLVDLIKKTTVIGLVEMSDDEKDKARQSDTDGNK